MLIDWLTLRYPIDRLNDRIKQMFFDNMGRLISFDAEGNVLWEKASLDLEGLRSDSDGLYMSMTGDGTQYYLTIGASPSSLENFGLNVFGHLDIVEAAQTLVDHASYSLKCILPHARLWQCRRVDITCNYDLGSKVAVKQALRTLLGADRARRKATSDTQGGDSVYWNPKSDLMAGKAYHKGPQIKYRIKKNLLDLHPGVLERYRIQDENELLELADRMLRFELKLGSRWFRRREEDGLDWKTLTPKGLIDIFNRYWSDLLGDDNKPEINTMDDIERLLLELVEQDKQSDRKNKLTQGRAMAALGTWERIKEKGYEYTKSRMTAQTFMNHKSILRRVGLTDADFSADHRTQTAQVIPLFRQAIVLSQPVLSFDEMRRRA